MRSPWREDGQSDMKIIQFGDDLEFQNQKKQSSFWQINSHKIYLILGYFFFLSWQKHLTFYGPITIAPDKMREVKLTLIDTTCINSSPNPMFEHLLESSHESSQWDDSNRWIAVWTVIEIHTLSATLH